MKRCLAVFGLLLVVGMAWAFLPVATGPAVTCRGLSEARCDHVWRDFAAEHDDEYLLPAFAAEVESFDGGRCISSISVQWGPLPWSAYVVQSLC